MIWAQPSGPLCLFQCFFFKRMIYIFSNLLLTSKTVYTKQKSAMTLSTSYFETIKVFKKMSILLRGQMKSIVEEDVRCNLSHCPRAPYFPHIPPYLASSEIGKCIKTPVRSINLHTTAQTAIHSLLVQKVTLDSWFHILRFVAEGANKTIVNNTRSSILCVTQ